MSDELLSIWVEVGGHAGPLVTHRRALNDYVADVALAVFRRQWEDLGKPAAAVVVVRWPDESRTLVDVSARLEPTFRTHGTTLLAGHARADAIRAHIAATHPEAGT